MSARDARQAIETFFSGFNDRDIGVIRGALHYPHVRFASGTVTVAAAPAEYDIPFDLLVAAEGWDYSTLDAATVVHEGPDKVHFDVRFRRYHADGSCYAEHAALWIVTRDGDHWGIQGRSSYAP